MHRQAGLEPPLGVRVPGTTQLKGLKERTVHGCADSGRSHTGVLSRSLHEETVSRPGPGPIDPPAAHLEDSKDTSRAETRSGIDSSELKVASWTC